jgi:hypothetical protein
MLGRHPDLCALPELNLFVAGTLGELIDWENEVGTERGYMAGMRRTIAQLEFGKQSRETLESARAWLGEHRQWTTDRMFHWLVSRVAPRQIVDKSPRTAMARSSCQRLLATVPEGYYLHLTRHPVSSIRSLASNAKEQGPHISRFCARIWLDCQQTILDVTEKLDQRRGIRIRGEDLLRNSEKVLREIAFWLRLSTSHGEIEQMKHPEQWPFIHSLPGVPDSDTDPGFRANPCLQSIGLIPDLQEIRALDLGQALTEQIISVGRNLGYS